MFNSLSRELIAKEVHIEYMVKVESNEVYEKYGDSMI